MAADLPIGMLNRDAWFRGLLLILAAWIGGYLWNVRPNQSPNDNARWDTCWSLVEFGTYEIFDTPEAVARYQQASGRTDVPLQFPTIDKVMVDGKSISSKPPLLPTVIAGYWWLIKQVIRTPVDNSDPKDEFRRGSIHIYIKATLLGFQLLPFLYVIVLYRRFLDELKLDDFTWSYCLLAGGLGTLATGYLATLNNHVIAYCLAFFTAYHVRRVWQFGATETWRWLVIGLCAAGTAACELPAGLLVLGAGAALLRRGVWRCLWTFVPAVAVVTFAFFLTNYLAIGSPIPAYMQKRLYDYPGSYWTDSAKKSGIDALNDFPETKWLYLVHLTIGHHGLISLTPIWLLAAWGWRRSWRQSAMGERPLLGGTLAISSLVFLFYWLVTGERNYGGFCHGPRWLIWLGGLWLYQLPAGVQAALRWRHGRRCCWCCLGISVFSAADTWYSPWTRSWLHRILRWWGVILY